MARLFVAIRPPQPVRAMLLGMMGGVSGARWQSDDQLHLTLRFIGEADRHAEADLVAALAAVRHPPFEIAIEGIGSFERRGEPQVLWAGVTPRAELKALHKKVDQACQRAGFAPEGRAYAPHITLARLKRGAGPIRHLLEAQGGAESAPFPVEMFCLFESELTPEGPIYSPVERYRLG
jgi:RNA 2',3'-cyclic 3'-phosphodiesterase